MLHGCYMQVLWSVLQAYADAEAAIRAALSDPAAVRAAAAKKAPGAPKDPVDPDEWLPVSCNYCGTPLAVESSTGTACKY